MDVVQHGGIKASMGSIVLRLVLLALSLWVLSGCSEPRGRSLGELVVRDSVYLDPETLAPYSGPVFRVFAPEDGGGVRLRATLRNGAWEGEMTIYHSTGRIRQQGETASGTKCGGWTENDQPVAPASLYEEIKADLESLVMYAPCPGG